MLNIFNDPGVTIALLFSVIAKYWRAIAIPLSTGAYIFGVLGLDPKYTTSFLVVACVSGLIALVVFVNRSVEFTALAGFASLISTLYAGYLAGLSASEYEYVTWTWVMFVIFLGAFGRKLPRF